MGFGNWLGLKSGARSVVVCASELRGQMVRAGDLRNEIGFQNDINILLAALDDGSSVWAAEAPLLSPDQRLTPGYDDGPPTLSDLQATAEMPTIDAYMAPQAA